MTDTELTPDEIIKLRYVDLIYAINHYYAVGMIHAIIEDGPGTDEESPLGNDEEREEFIRHIADDIAKWPIRDDGTLSPSDYDG